MLEACHVCGASQSKEGTETHEWWFQAELEMGDFALADLCNCSFTVASCSCRMWLTTDEQAVPLAVGRFVLIFMLVIFWQSVCLQLVVES